MSKNEFDNPPKQTYKIHFWLKTVWHEGMN